MTERARSSVLCFVEVGVWGTGEPLRLSGRLSLRGDSELFGVFAELRLANVGGNQMFLREGVMGIPMRACMAWVKGAVIGFGEVGGRETNSRRSGERSL